MDSPNNYGPLTRKIFPLALILGTAGSITAWGAGDTALCDRMAYLSTTHLEPPPSIDEAELQHYHLDNWRFCHRFLGDTNGKDYAMATAWNGVLAMASITTIRAFTGEWP